MTTLVTIVGALLAAFALTMILAPIYIGLLRRLGYGKQIRSDGPQAHLGKAGTPTMGGMLMVAVVLFLAMAMRIEDAATLTPMLTLMGVGILGAVDDFVNVRSGIGMRGRWKLVWQTIVAILAGYYIQRHFDITAINIPGLGEIVIGPVLFVAFVAFVIVGTSNAVNLTDGLDGLAGGVLIFSFVAYLLVSLVPIEGVKLAQPNLAILCALIIGVLVALPVVQRPPRPDHHGRLGVARPRRHPRGRRHRERPAAAAGDRRHRLLRGDHERRAPGPQLPPAGSTYLPHGAAPPPLRAHGLGRGEDHGPLLDRGGPGRDPRVLDLPRQRERRPWPMMTASPAPISSAADLRGRRAIVLGLARSGVAAARFLADQGAAVTVYDRRSADELAEEVAALEGRPIALALGVEPGVARDLLVGADLVVTSPSVSPRFPTTDAWLREALTQAEARGTELVSEVELFLRLTRARVLGVTGTKGKTTSTALVAAMLEAADMPSVVGGNIGTPLVERALDLPPTTWAVLELSELQLPTISRGADIALYTNIGADHLDRHGSVEAYRAVKARLAELRPGDGDGRAQRRRPGIASSWAAACPDERLAWYGLAPSSGGPRLAATVEGGSIVLDGEPLVRVDDVRLPGRHMRANILGAAVAAHLAGADPSAIGRAVRDFAGVPHRLETVATVGDVRWVNDSQATIPMAAIAALESFEAPIVVIAGGQGKGLEQEPFAEAIVAHSRAAILIGETADELEGLVAGRVPVRRAASMDEAVAEARDLAQPGDVVVLAPAAASFDMFADYAARGDAFRAAVSRIEESR